MDYDLIPINFLSDHKRVLKRKRTRPISCPTISFYNSLILVTRLTLEIVLSRTKAQNAVQNDLGSTYGTVKYKSWRNPDGDDNDDDDGNDKNETAQKLKEKFEINLFLSVRNYFKTTSSSTTTKIKLTIAVVTGKKLIFKKKREFQKQQEILSRQNIVLYKSERKFFLLFFLFDI